MLYKMSDGTIRIIGRQEHESAKLPRKRKMRLWMAKEMLLHSSAIELIVRLRPTKCRVPVSLADS